MGFGSFVKGLQGGAGFMSDIKDAKQKRDLYSILEDKASGELEDWNYNRRKMELPEYKRKKRRDPFIFQLMEGLGKGTEAVDAPGTEALPTAGSMDAMTQDYVTGGDDPEMDSFLSQFAGDSGPALKDGGKVPGKSWDGGPDWEVDPEGKARPAGRQKYGDYEAEFTSDSKPEPGSKRRAPTSKEGIAARERVGRGRSAIPEGVQGDPEAYRPARKGQVGNAARAPKAAPTPAPRGMWGGARALAGGAGTGLALASLFEGTRGAIEGGIEGYFGDSADRFAEEDRELSMLARKASELGGFDKLSPEEQDRVTMLRNKFEMRQRMGSMEDGHFDRERLGDTARGATVGGIEGLMLEEARGRWTDEPAPRQAIPQPEPEPGGTTPGTGGRGGARKPAVPETVDESPEDPLANFTMDKMAPEKIPNFSNKQWYDHREELIKENMMSGMTLAEARQSATNEMFDVQQKGFMHFTGLAAAAMEANDNQTAMAAIRAAWQYMPSTTDVRLGEYQGHIVAVPFDEETGEPTGGPVIINAERLNAIRNNFAQPMAWAQHAQAGMQFEERMRRTDEQLRLVERGQDMGLMGDLAKAGSAGQMDINTQTKMNEALNNDIPIALQGLGLRDDQIGKAIQVLRTQLERDIVGGHMTINEAVTQLLTDLRDPRAKQVILSMIGG